MHRPAAPGFFAVSLFFMVFCSAVGLMAGDGPVSPRVAPLETSEPAPAPAEEREALDNSAHDLRPIQDQLLDPAPSPQLPMTSQSALDMLSRMTFGGSSWDAALESNNYLYAGLGEALAIYWVWDKDNPQLMGWIDLGGPVQDIQKSGDYVYATATTLGLKVVDVSDPTAPTLAATVDTSFAFGLDLWGTYAFVADLDAGLRIIDISTPTSPSLVSTYNSPGYAMDVDAVSSNYVYLADEYQGLRVVDVSNKAAPVSAGNLLTAGWAYDVKVSGSYAYLAVYNAGLQIVDVSTPTSPTSVSTIATAGSAYGVEISGFYAYVSAYNAGLEIINVNTPAAPFSVSVTALESNTYGINLSGSTVYMASPWGGIEIVDISNVSVPVPLTQIKGYKDYDVAVQGNLAVVAGHTLGIHVVDWSNPARPQKIATHPTTQARRVDLKGNYAYVADNGAGLVVVDLSDPANPATVGSYNTTGLAYDVVVVGDKAYVADYASGLQIIDVSDPTAPAFLGNYDTSQWAEGVAVEGDYAFLACDSGDQLVVLDVSDPTNPTLAAEMNLPGGGEKIKVVNGRAYIAANSSGLHLVDVTTPSSPFYMTTYDPGVVYDVEVVGDLVYLAAGSGGARVLDFSNPYSPSTLAYFVGDDICYGVAFKNGYGFMSDEDQGSYIFHYTGQCLDSFEANDTFDTAALGEFGTTIDSKICVQGDMDYYTFQVTGAGTLEINMNPPSNYDFDLYLYDSNRNLLAFSKNSAAAAETISYDFTAPEWIYVLVRGNSDSQYLNWDGYSLDTLFTPDGGGVCSATPDEAVYIPNVTLDLNGYPVIHIQDPNQPAAVTGYNLYRSTTPTGPWTLMGSDVVDMDEGTANIQWVDLNGDVGGPYYYEAYAFNGVCSAEGP